LYAAKKFCLQLPSEVTMAEIFAIRAHLFTYVFSSKYK